MPQQVHKFNRRYRVFGVSAHVSRDLEPPPQHNPEAEHLLLAAILLDDSHPNLTLGKVRSKLRPPDFFNDSYRVIFTHMLAIADAGRPQDLADLVDHLRTAGDLDRTGGPGCVANLLTGVPFVTHVDSNIRAVKEKAVRRAALAAAELFKQRIYDGEDADVVLATTGETLGTLRNQLAPISWQTIFHRVDELPEGEVPMLIDQFLPEGVTFIGGTSGLGKTWLALSMVRALHTGEKFLGVWNVSEAVYVLYLCPEMGARSFRRRCERLGIGGERFRCMTLADGVALDLADPQLLAALRELRPVVFLDTAIRFSRAESENSATENSQGLARAIFALLHAGARAVVCLHHRSKDAARTEELTLENTLRGTGDLGAICDSVYGLQYDRGDRSPAYLRESKRLVRVKVCCVKTRDFQPPDEFRVQLDPFLDRQGDMGVLADEPGIPAESAAERLSRAIAENRRASKSRLAAAMHISRNRIGKIAASVGWHFDKSAGWVKQ